MKAYHELLRYILDNGKVRGDRTGTGTRSVFGYQSRYDLSRAFPLLTTKKVHWKSVVHELLWFLRGDTNIRYLVQNGVKIWNDWPFQYYLQSTDRAANYKKHGADWKAEMKVFTERIATDSDFAAEWGELGPVYGKQWRDFNGVDQLRQVIEQLKTNPESRRHVVTAWNPADIPEMAKAGLPPCHAIFQFYVSEGRLSCQLYQRSADVFLGVPFNIASYALLTQLLARECGLLPGEFVHTLGDAHLYLNHIDQARLQLSREARALPTVTVGENAPGLFELVFEDITLHDYGPWPAIRAPIAV